MGYHVSSLDQLGSGPGFRKIREPLGVTAEAARRLVKRAVTAVREEALARSDAA